MGGKGLRESPPVIGRFLILLGGAPAGQTIGRAWAIAKGCTRRPAPRKRPARRDPAAALPAASGRRGVRAVLWGRERAAVDQLDPVAVRVGDEGDVGQLVTPARLVRRLLRLHADLGEVGERP